jgi:hypothetical protein
MFIDVESSKDEANAFLYRGFTSIGSQIFLRRKDVDLPRKACHFRQCGICVAVGRNAQAAYETTALWAGHQSRARNDEAVRGLTDGKNEGNEDTLSIDDPFGTSTCWAWCRRW